MSDGVVRWVRAETGRAHLDLGERSSRSFRLREDHVIVAACHAILASGSSDVSMQSAVPCPICLRVYRKTIKHELQRASSN